MDNLWITFIFPVDYSWISSAQKKRYTLFLHISSKKTLFLHTFSFFAALFTFYHSSRSYVNYFIPLSTAKCSFSSKRFFLSFFSCHKKFIFLKQILGLRNIRIYYNIYTGKCRLFPYFLMFALKNRKSEKYKLGDAR